LKRSWSCQKGGSEFSFFGTHNVPAGTDQAIIDRLSNEVVEILAISEVRDAIEQTGLHITASGAKVLQERMAREVPMWPRSFRRLG
jgi:tripartite-type tricarboxylate transporter receptor subunit TctC